jgi:hypothetical protein
MILETSLILGGAIALIAVQPPVRRLFPPKPKQTEWEKFWAGREAFWKHVDCCGWECDSKSSDIADHVLAAAKKPRGLSVATCAEELNTRYVPQMKALLDKSAELVAEYNKPTVGLATDAKTDIEAVDRAVKEGASAVFLPEKKQWVEFLQCDPPPARLDAALSKATTIQRSTWTDGLSQAQSWQTPNKWQALQDRAAFASDAERRGMQVYLDHKTNEYRARETQLSRNLHALEAALGKATFYVGSHTYAFPGGIELSSSAIQSARSAEDVWKLISDKPAPTQEQMNLRVLKEELKRMHWENTK